MEPDPARRRLAGKQFGLEDRHCFESVEQLVNGPIIADAIINGTMDDLHVQTTLPLLKAGYDVLLEKPIATSEKDMLQLYQAATEYGRTVMVCHVLRYAPFYRAISSGIPIRVKGMNIRKNESRFRLRMTATAEETYCLSPIL